MKNLIKMIIAFPILLFMGLCIVSAMNQSNVSTVENCKIIELQQQQIINGSKEIISTEIRYLVVTDKETFVCESSLLNGKFNNSDIFWHLKKDSTYNFKVAGFGKSFITEYRNILEVINN